MSARTLLVTGASGHLGRAVVEALLASGAADRIVAGSRRPEALADLSSRGVEARRVDFDDDVATLAKAFAGVDRLLIVSTDALDRPGHRLEQHLRAIEAAKSAGAGHVLYTSMSRPHAANPMWLASDHRGTEEAIVASGIPYTILRHNWYFENIAGSIPHAVASGVWSDAVGEGRVAYVARRDCARADAAALASSETESAVLDITGPELLSGSDIAGVLSSLSGRSVSYQPVDEPSRRTALVAAGLPEGYAAFIVNSESGMSRGWLAVQSDDVRHLTGSVSMSFRDHMAEQGLAAGI